MAQRRIDFLSLMYKKSSVPGNSPTASRQRDRATRHGGRMEAIVQSAQPDARDWANADTTTTSIGFGGRCQSLRRASADRPTVERDAAD